MGRKEKMLLAAFKAGIHIGCPCPQCQEKKLTELYAEHLGKVYEPKEPIRNRRSVQGS